MSYRYDIHGGLQRIKTKTTIAVTTLGLVLGAGGLSMAIFSTAGATSPVIYNNIPSPQPGNVPSVSFEATGTSEYGGQVAFAGSARQNPNVTVLMSSWGCQTGHWTSDDCLTTPGATFSEPITLNIYAVNGDNSPGTKLATQTQTFSIPYRPSANNPMCTGAQLGEWYSSADHNCYNGFATPISFSFTGLTLPNNAIISVAYNTSDYGYSPIGRPTTCSATEAGCGYDSLNVGTANALTVGSYTLPNDAYQDTVYDSCSNGSISPFGLDSGCWAGYQPAFEVTASPNLPASKDQCMNGGWENYGTTFKNQGDCVSYIATGGKNQPSGN